MLRKLFLATLVLAFTLTCVVLYLVNVEQVPDFQTAKNKSPGKNDVITVSKRSRNKTTACIFPDFDPYNKDVMKLAGLDKKPIQCEGYMPDITYIKGNQIWVNTSKSTSYNVSCKYREIYKHPNDDSNFTFGEWSSTFNTSVELPETSEFLIVICENNTSIISKTYYTFFPKREELADMKLKKRLQLAAPKETLNVIMIGMDGVSRHQYMRSMNLTYNYLMKELNSFDMTMYSQLGLNTFPNYLTLLTGYSESEVIRWWNRSSYTDEFDLIWGDYRRAGYKTLFTEDAPSGGGFHYQKKGFSVAPTTYYSRPITLAMEKDKELWRVGEHCAGNQPEIKLHLNYVESLFDRFPKSPIFAMAFFTKLTHDDMSNSKQADEIMFTFYKRMKEKGYLDNTVLITFSDHGPRMGVIRATLNGMVESRSPYAIVTFPKWFLDKYSNVNKNLKTNTKRLTTHYDVHATLQDLLYFKASGIVPLTPRKHGISLFNVIPESRTCEDIPIPMEFCLCNQVKMVELALNSSIAHGFSEIFVKKINSKTNPSLCAELKLDKILRIVQVTLPYNLPRDITLYKIKLQTLPGEGIFEGTIQTPKANSTTIGKYIDEFISKGESLNLIVGEDFDRLSLYRGQADCESDFAKKQYCYCKDLITT